LLKATKSFAVLKIEALVMLKKVYNKILHSIENCKYFLQLAGNIPAINWENTPSESFIHFGFIISGGSGAKKLSETDLFFLFPLNRIT
jgi:hypothetical protein